MKKILLATVAAGLLASGAQAQSVINKTNELHYNIAGAQITNPSGFGGALAIAGAELAIAGGIGTRYTANTLSFGNTNTATPSVATKFFLKGQVSKDCSFYAGNGSSATNIDFGTIGVQTGNNANVTDAFEMVAPATALITSATAGCNFNNTVSLSKNDIRGMVNNNPGGYDSNQFQANIPYSAKASWTGVGLNSVGAGGPQEVEVATGANAAATTQGAWRSGLRLDINAPRIQDKALVAGDYAGELTLTLAAL